MTGPDIQRIPVPIGGSPTPVDPSIEGCICGHGAYEHANGGWPTTPVNGACFARGCDCAHLRRGVPT